MFRELRNRMIILCVTVISITMLTAFAAIYLSAYLNIRQNCREELEMLSTRAIAAAPADETGARPLLANASSNFSKSFIVLTNENGTMTEFLSSVDMPEQSYREILSMAWSSEKNTGKINYGKQKWEYLITELPLIPDAQHGQSEANAPAFAENSVYRVSFIDISASEKTLFILFITLLVVGFAMLTVIFLFSLYFSNRAIRPVEESWKKQKQFVADASHELKTPIAIINSNTEALLSNGQKTINSQKKWIGYIQDEVNNMNKLITDMLYLAKTEESAKTFFPVDFSAVVIKVLTSMEAVIYEKEINLTAEIEPGIIVPGDSEKLMQAVCILIENATKYTERGGKIIAELYPVKGKAIFTVKNTGEGIPQKDLPFIFDRFYRSDSSHSKETGGFGLGLSIAKAVVTRIGGSITARSDEVFTTFQIELKMK